MGKFFDLLLERKKIRDKYLENIDYYLSIIKSRAKKVLGEGTKVYLFGSYLKKDFGPNSDVDILVVAENYIDKRKKGEILVSILEGFEVFHPFEVHLVSKEEFENWYLNFIKENYQEIG